MSFIPVIKAEFQHHYSLHNPSEIILICWFDAQETFLIIINFVNWYISFRILWVEISKEQHSFFFLNKSFFNYVKSVTVTLYGNTLQ